MRTVSMGGAALFVVAASGLASGQDGVVSFATGARVWFSSLDGDGRVDAPGFPGTPVDFEDTLGIEPEETGVVPHLHFGVAGHHFFADYWSATYEGSETLSRAVTFNGTTYGVATTVESRMELTVGSVLYQWELLSPPEVGVGFGAGPVVGAKFIRFDGRIKSAVTAASENFDSPVPVVGAGLRLGLMDRVDVRAMVTGVSGTYAEIDATFLDGSVEAAARWSHVTAGVGFRAIAIDARANDGATDEIEVDLRITGPYATVALYF